MWWNLESEDRFNIHLNLVIMDDVKLIPHTLCVRSLALPSWKEKAVWNGLVLPVPGEELV